MLWILSLAAHLGYDQLVAGHITGKNGGNVGDATVLLYLVVSLTIQRYVLLNRVARQEAAGQLAAGHPGPRHGYSPRITSAQNLRRASQPQSPSADHEGSDGARSRR